MIAGKMYSQSPILKGYGVLNNLVILTKLHLHPPHLPVLPLPICPKFRSEKCSSMLEECEPVEFLGHSQVEFFTQFAHTSK